MIHCVYVGNQIAKALSLGKSSDEKVSTIHQSTWDNLGIPGEELRDLMLLTKKNFETTIDSWSLE